MPQPIVTGKAINTGQTKPSPTASSEEAIGGNPDSGGGEGEAGEGGRYSSEQVAAIILPVVLVMVIVLVSSLAGMWLVLQRRKRYFNPFTTG